MLVLVSNLRKEVIIVKTSMQVPGLVTMCNLCLLLIILRSFFLWSEIWREVKHFLSSGTWPPCFFKCLMRLTFLSKFNLITFCNVTRISKTYTLYYHPYFNTVLRFAGCYLPAEFQHRICIRTDAALSFVYINTSIKGNITRLCCTFKSYRAFCDSPLCF